MSNSQASNQARYRNVQAHEVSICDGADDLHMFSAVLLTQQNCVSVELLWAPEASVPLCASVWFRCSEHLVWKGNPERAGILTYTAQPMATGTSTVTDSLSHLPSHGR